jgi:hypothetical protein
MRLRRDGAVFFPNKLSRPKQVRVELLVTLWPLVVPSLRCLDLGLDKNRIVFKEILGALEFTSF